jgi:hypothetical protein
MDVQNLSSRQMARRGLLIGAALLPVYAAVAFMLGSSAGLAAMLSAGMLLIAALALWRLRRHTWFWLTLAALAAAHALAVALIRWPDRSLPAPELWPIGFADLLFDVGCIKLVELIVKAIAPGAGP